MCSLRSLRSLALNNIRMSSVRVPSRCEGDSSVFTTPGDVSPVAEYDVGRIYWTCMWT